jgi:hypothetical protein
VASQSEELGAIVSRLEEAAARLRDDAVPPPAPDRPPPPTERRRLGEVLDGLERANVEVRRARSRLAELEARLDVGRAA